jgi:hypothetical protein
MIDQGTIAKIDAGVTRSAFLDRHGFFAKECDTLHHVNVQFSDGSLLTISAVDFDSLSVKRQDKIREAGAGVTIAGVEPGQSWWDRFTGCFR